MIYFWQREVSISLDQESLISYFFLFGNKPSDTAFPISRRRMMKKQLAILLTSVLAFGSLACINVSAEEATPMTYAEYLEADLDSPVVVETYVQAKQSWWDDTATVYTQNEDGAFFIYGMACSEEDYEKLVPGQKIKVTGYKAEWSGEIEIVDATFELEDGSYIAEPKDATELLDKNELIDLQNQLVSFKGMTVEAIGQDDDGNDVACFYNWDNSGTQGDDLYFSVSDGNKSYTFTVESYLCDKDSDVYQAVEGLSIGDVIDLEGFLYWYEGANPHIISVTPAEE